MIYFMQGIKKLGAALSLTYTSIMLFIFIVVDSVLMSSIEDFFEIQHKVYLYDIMLLLLWFVVYLYGFIVIGKSKNF